MNTVEPKPLALIKLDGLFVPGNVVEMSPDEADQVGAFAEAALSDVDAMESTVDLEVIK